MSKAGYNVEEKKINKTSIKIDINIDFESHAGGYDTHDDHYGHTQK
jgi:hypothetical protein